MNIAHSSFISSEGENISDRGWYKTKEENEVIEFEKPVNSLAVEAREDQPLAIQINNIDDIWYISGGAQEGLEGLRIQKMKILEVAGTEIKWKALTY